MHKKILTNKNYELIPDPLIPNSKNLTINAKKRDNFRCLSVIDRGLEPRTPCLKGRCSTS